MEDVNLLLTLASKSIESAFDKTIKFDKEKLLKENPDLNEQRATFVTLTLDGKLRGCIGSLIAHRTLLEDILHNAKSAAFSDFRFNRLTPEEFQKVKIEISILTPPEVLEYVDLEDLKEKLIPNKHGVILELDGKRATFLPQVWEQLPTFNEFMVHLCQKAGLNPSSLSGFPKIQTYEALKIK
ncbi:MAG: AmmeMemoRadiSam system protein A [Arcobacter sp.]|nr:MAG: AmmeMemoRadiSam system protein A [Arcobacter sp.]